MKTIKFDLPVDDPYSQFIQFTQIAFNGMIHRRIPTTINNEPSGKIKITGASVAIDGQSVEITAEVDGLMEFIAIEGIGRPVGLGNHGTIAFVTDPAMPALPNQVGVPQSPAESE